MSYLGNRDRAPSWFLNGWEQWTELGSPLMYRYWWKHTVAFVLLALVPMAVIRLFAGWQLRDLGIRLRGSGREFVLVRGLGAVFVPVVWLASDLPSFRHTYPLIPAAADSAPLFRAHHGYFLLKWFAWEFFFRGLLLFGFERYIGSTAVLLSTLPFVVMHYAKPPVEMLSAVGAGFILCGIALRSRSILPGVLLHSLVALSTALPAPAVLVANHRMAQLRLLRLDGLADSRRRDLAWRAGRISSRRWSCS